MWTRASLAVGLLAVLVAGCGGGGGSGRLDRTAYLRQADAICLDVTKRQQALKAPTSLATIPAYVDKSLPIFDSGTQRLRKLRPPKDLDAKVKDWLHALEQSRVQLVSLKKAAEDKDLARVQALGAGATTSISKTHARARAIGLDDCTKF
jgi:hypothetical protein